MNDNTKKRSNALQYCIQLITSAIPLAKNDLRKRYSGSLLGIAWAYIQVIVLVLIYWFVFEFGLKVTTSDPGVPFIVWFIAGLMPYLFFQEIIFSTLGCMTEYGYLVKKIVFDINLLPLLKIIVCCFIYVLFLAIVIVSAVSTGSFTGLYLLQLIYYFICVLALAIPVAYLGSTISVFIKDFGQVVTILLNMLMWLTPIVWSYTIVSENLLWIFKLNPMFYIVQGFRESVLYGVGFWEHPVMGAGFWALMVVLWIVCLNVYRKLVPHLADVL